MAKKATFIVHYRRKRKGKTDYDKRLKLLKSGGLRLVVHPTNKNMNIQLVEYHPEGDKIISSASSKNLSEYGWNGATSNTSAAYLTGLLCAVKSGKSNAILDTGLIQPINNSRIYAAVNGAIDGGLDVPVEESVLPEEPRIKGEHAKTVDPSDFEEVKNKILETGKKAK